jgi:hypothetical protein
MLTNNTCIRDIILLIPLGLLKQHGFKAYLLGWVWLGSSLALPSAKKTYLEL